VSFTHTHTLSLSLFLSLLSLSSLSLSLLSLFSLSLSQKLHTLSLTPTLPPFFYFSLLQFDTRVCFSRIRGGGIAESRDWDIFDSVQRETPRAICGGLQNRGHRPETTGASLSGASRRHRRGQEDPARLSLGAILLHLPPSGHLRRRREGHSTEVLQDRSPRTLLLQTQHPPHSQRLRRRHLRSPKQCQQPPPQGQLNDRIISPHTLPLVLPLNILVICLNKQPSATLT
jgi:hypothetical protein